ncbi:tartrate-resistant acid phosphatase type 5-like [Ciona intestinalis]
MGRVVFGYGLLRGTVLKHKTASLCLLGAAFVGFLCYSYIHEGRPGKVRSTGVDYEGPDLFDSFSFLQPYSPAELEKLAIGEAAGNPLDPVRVVENLIELEEEALVQARSEINQTVLHNGPVYDDSGNEIGLRFLIISDWGGKPEPPYTTHTQMNVGRAMAEFSRRYDCSFVLSLGDNFCDKGVTSVDDHRFEDTFEDVFSQPSLQRPWYIIAGDKDYKGNVSAQIEYTKVSRRWSFESKYYKMSANLPTYRNISVDYVMIDTVELCGVLPPSGKGQPIGPANITAAEKQWAWLEHALKNSGAEYLVVGGHYPVYSGGRQGSTECLVKRLQPMLDKFRVSAYFSGHDHSVQHIKSANSGGVHYFVAGAASADDDRPEHLDGIYSNTRYFWTNHLDHTEGAFLYCDVRKDQMSVTFIKSDESILYLGTILPRSNPANEKPENGGNWLTIPVLKQHRNVPTKPKYFQPKPQSQMQLPNAFQQYRQRQAQQRSRQMQQNQRQNLMRNRQRQQSRRRFMGPSL